MRIEANANEYTCIFLFHFALPTSNISTYLRYLQIGKRIISKQKPMSGCQMGKAGYCIPCYINNKI